MMAKYVRKLKPHFISLKFQTFCYPIFKFISINLKTKSELHFYPVFFVHILNKFCYTYTFKECDTEFFKSMCL